jgi:hypothetical protein
MTIWDTENVKEAFVAINTAATTAAADVVQQPAWSLGCRNRKFSSSTGVSKQNTLIMSSFTFLQCQAGSGVEVSLAITSCDRTSNCNAPTFLEINAAIHFLWHLLLVPTWEFL